MKKNEDGIIKPRTLHILRMLTKRHLKMIFADHMRMMYTLMVPVVILVVYILFLRKLELSSISSAILQEGVKFEEGDALSRRISTLVDAWMMSGLLNISTITISLQTNALIVEDKEHQITRDFVSSPINPNVLVISYFLYNAVITALLSLVVLFGTLIFFACYGEFYVTASDFFLMLGILLYNVLLSTLFTTFICIFLKKESSLATVISVFSAAAGFLMGAYMPISMLPTGIHYFCAVFPFTYSCALSRFSYLRTPLSALTQYLTLHETEVLPKGLTAEEVTDVISSNFGYEIDFFGASRISAGYSAVVVLVFLLLFLVLNIIFSGKLARVEPPKIRLPKKKDRESK